VIFARRPPGALHIDRIPPPSAAEFRRYAADIAWETEVWLANNPDHMIHFNGPKFVGPYKPAEE
jgi:hypothetical protein